MLKGAQPGTLPVRRLTCYELVINLETARAIGIALPSSLLVRADRIVQ